MRRENVSLPPMAELKQPMVQPVARPIVLQPVALLPVSAVVAVNLGCECRWPFGDPKDRANFRFCGALAPLGQSYCTEHRAVAYVTVAKRQMEAA